MRYNLPHFYVADPEGLFPLTNEGTHCKFSAKKSKFWGPEISRSTVTCEAVATGEVMKMQDVRAGIIFYPQ